MSLDLVPLRSLRMDPPAPRPPAHLESVRVELPDGCATTLHVASYDRQAYRPRVVVLPEPVALHRWCREQGVAHAIVGGFFRRPHLDPLGELRVDGRPQPFVPFTAPWGDVRACLQIDGGEVRIARRDALAAEPAGDLLQAGPLLVDDGRSVVVEGEDPEGFSAASHQFDSDITLGRYPRAALALCGRRLLAVACDGRTSEDAGMTLAELAGALVGLGATSALNLDGGGSASLVHDGRLRNCPREEHGVDLLDGRPVATAVAFAAR